MTMLGYVRGLIEALNFGAISEALYRAAAVFLCLTVHESAHALSALALGDPTAKERHRISLNPLRHIDWLGLAMMFTAGFGWAKPVPVDPRYFRNPKWGMAATALAGPVSNLLLAVAALMLGRTAYAFGPGSMAWSRFVTFLIYEVAVLSLGLGVFNLLPVPPLDGSKVLGAFLPDRIYFRLMRYERYGMILLLVMVLTGVHSNFVSRVVSWLYVRLATLILF